LGSQRRKIIVGIDPGTTCGIAAITLLGKPLIAYSKREMTKRDAIEKIIALGDPVVVASDVTPAPEFVIKIASSLDAAIFTPERTLESREKRGLISDLYESESYSLRDSHAKDAMAAAIKAFKSLKNKFERAQAQVLHSNAKAPIEEVFALLAKGRSIQDAISSVAPKPTTAEKETRIPELRSEEPEVRALHLKSEEQEKRLKALEEENRSLRLQIASMRSSLEKTESLVSRLRRKEDREIRRQREFQQLRDVITSLRRQVSRYEGEIREYRERLDSLRHLQELQSRGEAILLKPIDSFTSSGVEAAARKYQISPGDSVLLHDASGGGASTARLLASRGVTCVVIRTAMAHQALDVLKMLNISVLRDGEVPIHWIEGYPFVMKVDLLASTRAKRDEEAVQNRTTLDQIISEYRKERLQ
jgi:predicted RNase H-like nuclease (RuvC/YqgF family)